MTPASTDKQHIPDPYIEIGHIGRPWGTDGRFAVTPSGAHGIRRFEALDNVAVVRNGEVVGIYTVEDVRAHRGRIMMKLATIDERETADEFRNGFVCVRESEAFTCDEWEFYHHDLLGMTVKTSRGDRIGIIDRIIETGANDVYVLKDSADREILIPAIREVIAHIDTRQGEMIIREIEGMLDLKQ